MLILSFEVGLLVVFWRRVWRINERYMPCDFSMGRFCATQDRRERDRRGKETDQGKRQNSGSGMGLNLIFRCVK